VLQGWFRDSDAETTAEEEETAKTRLGNKTKTQLEAEKGVFKQLLTAVVAAEADPALKQANDGFVDAVSEHFAMLFVSGMAPLQPGGSGRSGAILAKEAAARGAAEKAKKKKGGEEEAEEGKKDKKSKTPPSPLAQEDARPPRQEGRGG
jgi:transformation/transcription domain-associated protein